MWISGSEARITLRPLQCSQVRSTLSVRGDDQSSVFTETVLTEIDSISFPTSEIQLLRFQVCLQGASEDLEASSGTSSSMPTGRSRSSVSSVGPVSAIAPVTTTSTS